MPESWLKNAIEEREQDRHAQPLRPEAAARSPARADGGEDFVRLGLELRSATPRVR